MDGKVCVVTGATSGIGKAAATALARLGAQVVLSAAARDDAAARELWQISEELTGLTSGRPTGG